MLYISRIDETGEYGSKCKQLFNWNHVQHRWPAPAKVRASCFSWSTLVVAIKTVACRWRFCFIGYPANSDFHSIYYLSFQKLWDDCWKECLSHQEESLRVIGHDALQLLVDEIYPLVCWAIQGSKLVVKVTWSPSCVDKSCYQHETEQSTVATGYLHVGQHFYLCTKVSVASSCIGFRSHVTTLNLVFLIEYFYVGGPFSTVCKTVLVITFLMQLWLLKNSWITKESTEIAFNWF